MSQVVALDREKHRDLKVTQNCATRFAAKQHVLPVRAVEVGVAAVNMPVFVNQVPDSDQWVLSSMTSFTPQESLFVRDDGWQSSWVPTTLQTYPLLLVNAPNTEAGYAAGIRPDTDDFSTAEGEPLFTDDGKEAPFLEHALQLLEGDIGRDAQTAKFLNKMAEIDAIRPVNIAVTYGNDQVNTITGLFTFDEQRLKERIVLQ